MSPEEKQYLDARRMVSTYDDECPPTVRNDERPTEPMASPQGFEAWECDNCAIHYEEPQEECPNCGCESFQRCTDGI
jgi:rubrerythrin